MLPSAPGGAPLPALPILATVAVPVVLAGVTWAYGGWSGWVPLIAVLAALGVSAIVAPGRGPWLQVALAAQRSGGPPAATWRRALPYAGAAVLAIAALLAWLRMSPTA